MFEISCFGIMIALMGFFFGMVFKRGMMLLVSITILPILWTQLFQSELMILLFTLGGFIGSVLLYFFWARIRSSLVYEPSSRESRRQSSMDGLKAVEKETLLRMSFEEDDLGI
jgi:hypothetical protein